MRKQARGDARVRLAMTAPGVGAIVGLTYVAAIDDPARFSSSKTVGAHFGMTPKRYQSGEIDVTGRISRMGDGGVRAALYEAAHVILTRCRRRGLEELGGEARQACRHAEGKGGAGQEAGGDPASHAGGRRPLRCGKGGGMSGPPPTPPPPKKKRSEFSGRIDTPFPKRRPCRDDGLG